MTDDILDRAKAAREDVTEAPWRAAPHPDDETANMFWYIYGPQGGIILEVEHSDYDLLANTVGSGAYPKRVAANARFIATSRNLWPEMIAEIVRLRAERDRFEAALREERG